ncbi:DUF445 family protein [bacterium]|nr:MAG: DUF445 family protein [bacterium]
MSDQNLLTHAGERTKKLGSSLGKLISSHVSNSLPEPSEKKKVHTPPPPAKGHSNFILGLKLLPGFLTIVFIAARFWDFNGIKLNFYGNFLALDGLLTMISVSGLIGYLTNWLAITMLFKPKYKRPILGQGLIPSQKNRIAYRLAQAVSTDLINPEIIKQKLIESDLIGTYRRKGLDLIHNVLQSEAFRNELKGIITEYVSSLVENPDVRAEIAKEIISKIEDSLDNNSMEKMALKAYMLMRGEHAQRMVENAIAQLPQQLESTLTKLDESLDKIPPLIEEKSEQIEEYVSKSLFSILQQFDVHQLVEENIQRFDEERLSNLIKGTTNEQFQYIQYLGALLGMIGGFVIWQPVWATLAIGLIVGFIWGLDKWIGD